MQAIGRQPRRAPDGAPIHYERHRPEQTTLYRLVQQHAATFIAETEAATGAALPQFVKDEFEARRLPGMRHPGPRLLAAALRRLRPRQAAGLQLQAARVLPFLRGPTHGADGGALTACRHSSRHLRPPTRNCIRCCTRSSPARRKLLTRPALANERVQTNAAGQVVLKLKTQFQCRLTCTQVMSQPRRRGATAPRTRGRRRWSSCSGDITRCVVPSRHGVLVAT